MFTPYGGCGRECEKFLSVLAGSLAEKRAIPTSLVNNWLRTKSAFAVLRSALLCVRGSPQFAQKIGGHWKISKKQLGLKFSDLATFNNVSDHF